MDIIGQTISHYSVLDKIGEGGMGVVYRARDLKLDRFVALKFLPAHSGMNEEVRMRFLQEAKSAASLNHPNICTIHGIEEYEGLQFIIMEYVEGHTLQEKRPDRTTKQAIEIAIQIADGLAAAHEKGITHRDIKPDNIMIRKDGIVQIMDFGLAKLRGATRLTRQPATAGTAGYMSPEQAQGLEVDHRSDIFSLGVVLYELFTGEPPFTGAHDAALAYQIVNTEPVPMSAVRPDIDPEIERIVFECLHKDPDERYQSAREISRELRRLKRSSGQKPVSRISAVSPSALHPRGAQDHTGPVALFRNARLPWIVAGICLLGMIILGGLYLSAPAPDGRVIRAVIPAPGKLNFFMYGNEAGPLAMSPDGRHLAFVAADSTGRRYLYVRAIDEDQPRRLEGSEGALHPFWSPDNRQIGFFNDNKLKRIDASGGSPVVICDATNPRGGSWGADGTILVTPGASVPLSAVQASGGIPRQLTNLDLGRKENSHRWPWFMPDGKHFLYFSRTTASGASNEGDAVFIASLDLKLNRLLVHASSNAVYASGYLLYARGSSLVAQRFDPGSLELTGEAVAIAGGVSYDESILHSQFTASQTGVLLYQTGSVQMGSRLQFCDRSGKPSGRLGEMAEYILPRISPDGRKVVADIYDFQAHNNDLWIYDIAHGSRTRFTFSPAYEQYPIWSPGGEKVLFMANPGGVFDIYQKSSSGASAEKLVLRSPNNKIPLDCSSDGKLLLFQVYGGLKTQSDLWILPLSGSGADSAGKPYPFLQTEYNEFDGRFSPDGRWVAYTSNESGRDEIFVRLLSGPAGSGRWQVSVEGGIGPRWRRDGREIYFVSPQHAIMVADVALSAQTAEISNVRKLFEVPSIVEPVYPAYDVAPDGRTFLVNLQNEIQNQSPLNLVVNWDAGLKK